MTIWKVIRELLNEARDQLALDGYESNPGTEGYWEIEDEEEGRIGFEHMAGALVSASDENKNRREIIVRYPSDWYARAYGDPDAVLTLREPPKPGDRFTCSDCGGVHALIACSKPESGMLFYYCSSRLKLGVLGKFTFVGDPADHRVRVEIERIATEVPL